MCFCSRCFYYAAQLYHHAIISSTSSCWAVCYLFSIRHSENVDRIINDRPHENVRHGTAKHLLHGEELRRAFREVLVGVSAAAECHDGERGNGSAGYEEEEAPEVRQSKDTRSHPGEQRTHCTNLEYGFVVLAQFPGHELLIWDAHCRTRKR